MMRPIAALRAPRIMIHRVGSSQEGGRCMTERFSGQIEEKGVVWKGMSTRPNGRVLTCGVIGSSSAITLLC